MYIPIRGLEVVIQALTTFIISALRMPLCCFSHTSDFTRSVISVVAVRCTVDSLHGLCACPHPPTRHTYARTPVNLHLLLGNGTMYVLLCSMMRLSVFMCTRTFCINGFAINTFLSLICCVRMWTKAATLIDSRAWIGLIENEAY